ncbi:MAG: DUF1801 domain-containing protein [Phycisphaerales bacterium]|nr:DUF1801 domain-containing protein [Phycisphaerales bacterium]
MKAKSTTPKPSSKPTTPDAYIASLPTDRKEIMTALRAVIVRNLPTGFEECMSYGMIGYVVPHAIFPAGYHCDPTLPLPFMGIASQKSHIALYHMGIYMEPALFNWFAGELQKTTTKKPDMGKSCTRWKKPQDVPVAVVGQLVKKMTVKQWIALYQAQLDGSLAGTRK